MCVLACLIAPFMPDSVLSVSNKNILLTTGIVSRVVSTTDSATEWCTSSQVSTSLLDLGMHVRLRVNMISRYC